MFHRLNEFSIDIPPLRERKEDIPDFARFFLDLANKETGKQIEGFDEKVMDVFLSYAWPGNIRELRNVIRRSVLLAPSGKISEKALSSELLAQPVESIPKREAEEKSLNEEGRFMGKDLKSVSLEVEYQAILDTLKSVKFNKSKAAKILNIDRKTLYNKLKEFES